MTACKGVKQSEKEASDEAAEHKKTVRSWYGENKTITDDSYDKSLAVKCVNGTFVGKQVDSTIVFRGIPYVGKQPVGEGEGGSRTLTGGDSAVDGDEVGGIGGFRQCLLKTGIAGGALAVENAQRGQYDSGRGADGSNLLAGSELIDDSLADVLVFKQVRGSGHATWQE